MCAARQQQSQPFQQQDGHLISKPAEGRKAHAQYRWENRAPEEYAQMDVRVAWAESVPVDYPVLEVPRQYARYHEPSQMVIIADYKFLETALHLINDAPEHATAAVLEQIEAMGGAR
jgi:hypothetical protein